MAELASSMSGFLLPDNFQPLDTDSESDSEVGENDASLHINVPFSSEMSSSHDSSSAVKVEYLSQDVLKIRTRRDSFGDISVDPTNEYDVFTNDSSTITSDLGSSGGFSSVDLNLSSDASGLHSQSDISWRTSSCSRTSNSIDLMTSSTAEPVTPTKPPDNDPQNDPLTPTANLKMLLSAASPEIRILENKKKKARLFDAMVEAATQGSIAADNDPRVDLLSSSQGDNGLDDGEKSSNRKAKSLGLLCQKFLTRYPDYPEDGKAMEISLDVISKDLNVERRRIYDIVNVLESVEMVSRRAKNRYLWHGRTRLLGTLAKLKCLGQRQKFAEQLAQLQNKVGEGLFFLDDMRQVPLEGAIPMLFSNKRPLQDVGNLQSVTRSPVEAEMRKGGRDCWDLDDSKRDKTLGVMSQKFIMLFLVCKDRVISLDVAARILKGDQNYHMGENAKFKTKVRRLYDIANILTSLKLIDKIHLSEGRGRKPAFRWIGPDPDTSDVDISELPSGTKPALKHSYFPLPPVTAESWSTNPSRKQTSAVKKLPLEKIASAKSKVNWCRNASFSAICEVAEQECRKYSSAPNSPVKDVMGPDLQEGQAEEDGNGQIKEIEFMQEFEALRSKYPSCVSRLLSVCNQPESAPSQSDQKSPTMDELLKQSPTDGATQRIKVLNAKQLTVEGATNTNKGKLQKVVYVQRFVPLLTANTIAAIQASTTAQNGTNGSGSAIVAGNGTTASSPQALVSAPRPVVIPPTQGTVSHLLPLSNGSWVQLPSTGSRGVVNLTHPSAMATATTPAHHAATATSSHPSVSQVATSTGEATLVRRSKRPIKLSLDTEFEYQPLVKKTKIGQDLQNGENVMATKVRKSTVIVHPPRPQPHPQPDAPTYTQPQHIKTELISGDTTAQQ